MWPTPRWPRSPRRSAWPRGPSRRSSTAAGRPWPPGSARRRAMHEERLRSAVEALHRSVAEVDVLERLERLEGRRRRYRATSVAMAILLLAAVAGTVAVAAGRTGPPEPA